MLAQLHSKDLFSHITDDSQGLEQHCSVQLPSVRIHSSQLVTAGISHIHSPDRAELESFVSHMFFRTHKAEVKHFMPKLLSLRNENNELLAVCGIRHAEEDHLFLETYLQSPVENVLSEHIGQPVTRNTILEIGNLAVANPASIRSLLASVSLYLHSTDSQWAVFTGITSLRNSLNKLNMPIKLLGEAKITCLPEQERASWGSYYDEHPYVMAIPRLH